MNIFLYEFKKNYSKFNIVVFIISYHNFILIVIILCKKNHKVNNFLINCIFIKVSNERHLNNQTLIKNLYEK